MSKNGHTSCIDEFYYDYGEAFAFIAECERDGVEIFQIDVLRREEDGALTLLHSTAWGSLSPRESWEEARHLLRSGIPHGGNVVLFVT